MNQINFYSVFDEAERKFLQYSRHKFLAESSVFVNSTLRSISWVGDIDRHYELRIVLYDKKKTTLERLLILSYYVNENLGYLLRSEIHDAIKGNIDLVDLEIPLKSRNYMKLWLADRISSKGAHWFFGNFLNKKDWETFLSKGSSLFKIKRICNHKRYNDTLPEKRTVGVGYKDKGTLPKDLRGSMKNFMLTSVQNEIENNRDICETTRYLIEGFLT